MTPEDRIAELEAALDAVQDELRKINSNQAPAAHHYRRALAIIGEARAPASSASEPEEDESFVRPPAQTATLSGTFKFAGPMPIRPARICEEDEPPASSASGGQARVEIWARCPACRIERTDYEGEPGKYLPTCPNCGAPAAPVVVHTATGSTCCPTEEEEQGQ